MVLKIHWFYETAFISLVGNSPTSQKTIDLFTRPATLTLIKVIGRQTASYKLSKMSLRRQQIQSK